AYVIGTASAAKHDFVRGLGADEVIDYRTQDFTEAAGRVDAVLDTIGGDYLERDLAVLNDGGTLVSLAYGVEADLAARASAGGVRAGFMLVEPDQAGMRAVRDLVESGRLTPTVEAVLPLAEAAKAHELSESGRTSGKIVLAVRED